MANRYLAVAAVVTGLIALAGCLGGGSGGTGPSGYTTELEGTWVYTESDTNYTFTLTWAFTDSNWTRTDVLVTDQSYNWAGTFELNTGTSPREIDFYCSSSSDTSAVGLTALGIYSLNSTATACTIAVNDFGDTVRPSDFYYGWVLNKQ
ncbi:MAG: hypothetical protein JXA64_09135 [Candidatus Fermentibacteraceae bacterium]|nr:hypothetical protein [Candidatus Fermentibacteraceae bacterium]MBN2609265.1 hypothetical protein [Candidatus Fermentibacteraceae bacterium]